MCVGCTIAYGQGGHPSIQLGGGWQFRGFWGKWYNFIPPKFRVWDLLLKSAYVPGRSQYYPWRGEGHPAPWIMIWKNDVFGFQAELSRCRPWLHPELTPKLDNSRQFMWGLFCIAWRTR